MLWNKKKVQGNGFPVLLSAFFGLAVAGVFGVLFCLSLAQPRSGTVDDGGINESVRVLSEAVAKGDADTAMSYIDFEALFEDVYRRNLSARYQVDAADPSVTEMYKSVPPYVITLAKNDLKTMLKAEEIFIDENEVIREDPAEGTLPDMLRKISEGRIRAMGDGSARIEFQNYEQYFILTRSEDDGKWRVTGFSGFGGAVDEVRAQIEKTVQDRIMQDVNALSDRPTSSEGVK